MTSRGIGLGSTAHIREESNTPLGNRTPEIIGAGTLMGVGAGMILLAFLDPEPTTKLGLLVGGGATAVLGGGAILLTIIITRENYEWEVEYDRENERYVWRATPRN